MAAKIVGIGVGVAVVALIATACSDTGSGGGGDASAELACSHFRNVAADVRDGILTDSELREKLKEVYDSARVSEETGVASAGRRMLAAVTADSLPQLESAVGDMDSACTQAGF